MNQDQTNARARLLWGEAPEVVAIDLIENGYTQAQVEVFIAQILAEKYQQNRRRGYGKLITGTLLAIVGATVLLYLLNNPDLLSSRGRQAGIVIATPSFLMLYGIWRLTDGIVKIAIPSNIRYKSPW